MDKNSIQNYENVKKLTKYQIRLASAGADKQDTYKYKIREYSGKLDGNGLNSKKILQTIQTGGDPFKELKEQQDALRATIDGLTAKVDRSVLEGQLKDITASAGQARTKYDDLYRKYDTVSKDYGKFAGRSIVGNYDLQNKLKEVSLESKSALTDQEVRDITAAVTLDDKGDVDVDGIIKEFLIDTHVTNLNEPSEVFNLARNIKAGKFNATELKQALKDKVNDPSRNDNIDRLVTRAEAEVANV